MFILAEIGKFTAEEYKQYIKSLDNMSDYYNVIDTAAEEAEKRGRAEGRAEGIEEAKMEVARRMLAAGMSVEQICELTGMSTGAIRKL